MVNPEHPHRGYAVTLSPSRIVFRFLAAIILLALISVTSSSGFTTQTDPAQAQQNRGSHIGYGISVLPHVQSRPDLLDNMNMDWVKIYSTSQLNDYPNQRVLYRVDVPMNPDDYDGWEQGLPALARELADRGVEAVEIGNEANLSFEWGGRTPNSRLAADAQCRGYRAFKAAAPGIIVVAGGLAPTITTPDRKAQTDLDFQQEMFNAGTRNCFDVLAYHPYGFNQPPEADPSQHELVFRRSERMYQLMWNNGIRDRQIWITEFGWVRNPQEGGLDCANHNDFRDFEWMKVSRDVQADYTVRAFAFAANNWPWAGPMFLWNLNWSHTAPEHLSACNHMRWYSIMEANGNLLPTYHALVRAIPEGPSALPPSPNDPVLPPPPEPEDYRPIVSSLSHGLTKTMEAGCTDETRLGSFTVLNSGYPGHLDVDIVPANAPNTPRIWTNTDRAESGTEVEVFVDARGLAPGLHMVAINLRAMGTSRLSTDTVRGWLLVHYPTTPECVSQWEG